MPGRLWLDVGDLLEWGHHHHHVTGIQRVLQSVVQCLRTFDNIPIGYCAYQRAKGLGMHSATTVDEALALLSGGPGPSTHRPPVPGRAFGGPLKAFYRGLPDALQQLAWQGRDGATRVAWGVRRRLAADVPFLGTGDVLLNMGAPWNHPGYLDEIRRLKPIFGFRYAALVYDVLPVSHPRFFGVAQRAAFRSFLHRTMRTADVLITISEHAKAALQAVAQTWSLTLPRVEVIRLGAAIGGPGQGRGTASCDRPSPGFVLSVGTIDKRKNQELLVGVWRRLLALHGDAVPPLVLAGQWHLSEPAPAMAQRLGLDGHLVVLDDVDDADLCELYRNCRFTIFASHCEGWGLPVAESLALSRYCLASQATAIPEVAGGLIEYFDPMSEDQCFEQVCRILFEPGFLEARQSRIQASYRPVPWSWTARRIVEAVSSARTASPCWTR